MSDDGIDPHACPRPAPCGFSTCAIRAASLIPKRAVGARSVPALGAV